MWVSPSDPLLAHRNPIVVSRKSGTILRRTVNLVSFPIVPQDAPLMTLKLPVGGPLGFGEVSRNASSWYQSATHSMTFPAMS